MKNILKRGHPFRSVVGVEMSNNNVSADILCKIIIQSQKRQIPVVPFFIIMGRRNCRFL